MNDVPDLSAEVTQAAQPARFYVVYAYDGGQGIIAFKQEVSELTINRKIAEFENNHPERGPLYQGRAVPGAFNFVKAGFVDNKDEALRIAKQKGLQYEEPETVLQNRVRAGESQDITVRFGADFAKTFSLN